MDRLVRAAGISLLLAGAVVGPGPVAPSPALAATDMVILSGNGLAAARFGQTEAVAIARLEQSLGRPRSATPKNEAGNCTIDAAMQWKGFTAYFYHGRFVGYSTMAPAGQARSQSAPPGLATAKGLHVGDTLAEAPHLYGSALHTSYAQGGSWSARTGNGALDGYLTAELGQESPPPRILSIEAGAVGCPAASP